MKLNIVYFVALLCLSIVVHQPWAGATPRMQEHDKTHADIDIDLSEWELAWSDEFDYADRELDKYWESQNGPSGHILCSRWRENAVVSNGILELVNRKERRGGQDWTSGSIWTKKKFKYGYFECRYRYAEANGTNNSFWLMTRGADPKEGKRFEIDINEGHYPNEVNTNIHNWSDIRTLPNGKQTHPSDSKSYTYGTRHDYSFPLEIPVTTRKIRMVSNNGPHFHVREFRVFSEKRGKYPPPMSKAADRRLAGLVDYAKDPKLIITSSGSYNRQTKDEFAVDGDVATSWITQPKGQKWIEFEWPSDITVGCIQFINGWNDTKSDKWVGMASDFKIQYHDGKDWVDITSLDVTTSSNFGTDYHTFGLKWTEDEIVFYLDRKEIRRERNEFAFSESPIWLSLAIIKWDGPVTDAIDGTSMKVDWVRYYQPKSDDTDEPE
ncbi:family 16 glycosylhydrolase [Algisphaera agarilytica]|uniref:Beta-glucanase (GH16 family) n=1 Tax=Algisphaera agarilytica TaxID=1385975 RepID=A0A7X0H2Y0_9BACT|nr:family 16 glycosylhydrolase [Algisphaera agarilytica]MBB6428303.1 beta-glucanase (GH16 family) [Algisphaera agarilytica]